MVIDKIHLFNLALLCIVLEKKNKSAEGKLFPLFICIVTLYHNKPKFFTPNILQAISN